MFPGISLFRVKYFRRVVILSFHLFVHHLLNRYINSFLPVSLKFNTTAGFIEVNLFK